MIEAVIITGIGDQTHHLERATRHWERKYQVKPIVYQFGWEGPAEEADQRIESLEEYFYRIGAAAVIGVSAGASAGAILAAKDSGISFTNVCGRLHQEGNNIYDFERYKTRAPIFVETVSRAEAVLDSIDPRRAQIYRAPLDHLVPKQAVRMPGVRSRTVPMPSHGAGIYFTLWRRGRQITDHIKAQNV